MLSRSHTLRHSPSPAVDGARAYYLREVVAIVGYVWNYKGEIMMGFVEPGAPGEALQPRDETIY
eukprot:7583152-Lingulodinium_polyedra.AAC.1